MGRNERRSFQCNQPTLERLHLRLGLVEESERREQIIKKETQSFEKLRFFFITSDGYKY
jgi:hypothetical protein